MEAAAAEHHFVFISYFFLLYTHIFFFPFFCVEQVSKSMEAAAAEHLLGSMCEGDARFLSVSPEALQQVLYPERKHLYFFFY
jgi:hypothetical protein